MSGRDHGWDGIPLLDENFKIQSLPPGLGTPAFWRGYAEAAAFLRFWRASFLTGAELTRRASKLSPDALRIVRWAVTELGTAQQAIDRKQAAALAHRLKPKSRTAEG
jgi:hypothetical protein